MADPDREAGYNRPKMPAHILPMAGTMMGICTTLVGLVKIREAQTGDSRVDEFGGLVCVVFLFSALASYGAMRLESRHDGLSRRLENAADILFVLGLVCLAVLSVVFAYEVL